MQPHDINAYLSNSHLPHTQIIDLIKANITAGFIMYVQAGPLNDHELLALINWTHACIHALGEIGFSTGWKISIPAYHNYETFLQEFTPLDMFYHDLI